jgi:hypothetical protein
MSLRKAALVAAFFICSPALAYHLVLEANPTVPFPFLGRFGTVEIHVYPNGIRGETIWLNGFIRNDSKEITVENPLGRMYTEVPVTSVGSLVRKIAGAMPDAFQFSSPPPVSGPVAGTVHGIAANRYRIQYGPEAWIDLWTTSALGDAPQLRAIALQIVEGISPMSAQAAATIPGMPIYVELNFSHFRKLPLMKVKTLTTDAAGDDEALKVGRVFMHAPLLDSLWK